jgi:hypothetical protein
MQMPNRLTLQNHLIKLFSFGYSVDVATRQLLTKEEYRNYAAPETTYQGFLGLCKEISEEYGPYKKIQYIANSCILYHVDLGYFTYNEMDKELRPISIPDTLRFADKRFLMPKVREFDRVYNPTSKEVLQDGNPNLKFNTYKPAKWQESFFYNDTTPTNVELPDIHYRFLMNLTGGDLPSFEYILDWLAMALTDRNLTFLCTIGNEGVGKGVLYDLMKSLFAEQNCTRVFVEQLDTQFNGYLEGKKIIYIDELSINSTRREESVKDLVNSPISIELKGKDAYLAHNYANIYISSNNTGALRLSANQRRFSLVQLTTYQMAKWPEIYKNWSGDSDRIKVTSPENILQLGQFLLNRKFDKEAHRIVPFLSAEKQKELTEDGLKVWEFNLIFELAREKAGKTLTVTQLKEDLEIGTNEKCKQFVSQATLRALCNKYPGVFKIKQQSMGGKGRPLCIEFSELDEQDKAIKYGNKKG